MQCWPVAESEAIVCESTDGTEDLLRTVGLQVTHIRENAEMGVISKLSEERHQC